MRNYLLFLIILIICVSCTMNGFVDKRTINKIELIDSLYVQETFDKICYSTSEKNFYLMQKLKNVIYIYNNGKFVNQIGGTGFENNSFRKLSDITLGIDNHLYALDSFDKSIKRFEKEGVYLSKVNIDNVASPEKIVFTNYGSVLLFDSHKKEFFALDPFDFSMKYSFGKFQVEEVDNLFINGNYLSVYDKLNHETTIFNINGQYDNLISDFVIMDAFNNILTFKDNNVVDFSAFEIIFRVKNKITYFSIENNLMLIASGNYIKVYRLQYEYNQKN